MNRFIEKIKNYGKLGIILTGMGFISLPMTTSLTWSMDISSQNGPQSQLEKLPMDLLSHKIIPYLVLEPHSFNSLFNVALVSTKLLKAVRTCPYKETFHHFLMMKYLPNIEFVVKPSAQEHKLMVISLKEAFQTKTKLIDLQKIDFDDAKSISNDNVITTDIKNFLLTSADKNIFYISTLTDLDRMIRIKKRQETDPRVKKEYIRLQEEVAQFFSKKKEYLKKNPNIMEHKLNNLVVCYRRGEDPLPLYYIGYFPNFIFDQGIEGQETSLHSLILQMHQVGSNNDDEYNLGAMNTIIGNIYRKIRSKYSIPGEPGSFCFKGTMRILLF